MATESIRLVTRDRREVVARAEVTRYGPGARWLRGGGIAFVGLALALVFLPFPPFHLVTTWAFPLLGIAVGAYVARIPAIVGEVRAACPDCGVDFTTTGGSWEESLWVRCTGCHLPLRVEIDR